jgi:hypothetical protein
MARPQLSKLRIHTPDDVPPATTKQFVAKPAEPPPRQVWTCAVCGRRDFWSEGWAAFGTLDYTEAVVCSEECRQKYCDEQHLPQHERSFFKDSWK